MERGMQIKADMATRQAESSDFPHICEGCMGENPYVRMQRIPHAGTCKMCERPFTLFKWRPGRGEGYRKTEVCQTCSRLKNICQTCILDLQFGLPSQLRDAVLSEVGGATATAPESDIGREYQAQKQLQLLNSGENPWQHVQTPNELLLEAARSAVHDRSHKRVRLPTKKRLHGEVAADMQQGDESAITNELANDDFDPSLPPGISSVQSLQAAEQSLSDFLRGNAKPIEKQQQQTAASSSAALPSSDVQQKKRPLPPRPPGPPPAWAFKNKSNNGDGNGSDNGNIIIDSDKSNSSSVSVPESSKTDIGSNSSVTTIPKTVNSVE